MKWTTATALFLALSAGGVGVTAVMNRKPKEPLQILEEVRAELGTPTFDQENAVDRLASALADKSVAPKSKLEAQLLRIRADIYRDMQFFKDARTDLETLQANSEGLDRNLALEIIELNALDETTGIDTALSPLRTLAQREPEFGEAWALAGALSAQAGEEGLEEAFALAASSLAKSDLLEVTRIIDELASRSPDDPERDALLTGLNRSFYAGSGTAASDIQRAIAGPRFEYQEARRYLAGALHHLVEPEIVVQLGRLLERAGQLDLSIQLHRAARNIPEVASDPDAMAAFLEQLLKANRIAEGVKALREWDYTLGGTPEFYRSAGEVFFRAGEYDALTQVGQGLGDYGGEIGKFWERFFFWTPIIARAVRSKSRDKSGFAGAMDNAIKNLSQFVDDEDDSPEPFVGAKDAAKFLIADAYRVLGNKAQERRWLRKALEAVPERSSNDWVRMAELVRAQSNVPWKEVEIALSHALNLEPGRTAELSQLWYEAGNERLAKQDRDLGDFLRLIARGGFSAIAPGTAGPSTMTLIAMHQFRNGNYYEAIRAAETVRRDFRHLTPPLDIIIQAKLANKQTRPPKDDILQRIEAAGIDRTVEQFMSQLEGGRLDGRELVRAIQAAPERFGKSAVARYYLTLDDPATAGEALIELKDENAPAELKLLRARLLIESEKYKTALDELKDLVNRGDEPALMPEALLLQMDAYIGSGQIRELDAPARRMLANVSLSHPNQLLAIDRLATFGRVDLAIVALEKLDASPKTRTPDFYRRRVLVDALTVGVRGELIAQESILRSEAYLRDGTPEMTSLVLAVGERQWTRLPDLVDRLLKSEFKPTEKQETALLLLGERLQGGSRAAAKGLRSSPRDAEWAFLSAVAASLVDGQISLPEWFGPDAGADAVKLLRGRARQSPKDPRDALVLYLMADRPEWSPWVLPRLAELVRETGSSLWSQWLRSRALEARDDRIGTARVIASLIEKHPRFGPAHDKALKLAERRHPTEPLHPQLVRARRIRLQSLGEELIGNPIEIALAEAGELARRDKNVEAISRLQPEIKPGSPAEAEGRLILGLLMIREKQFSLAAEQLNEALKSEPGIFKEIVIDSLLYALRNNIEDLRSGDAQPQRGRLSEEASLAFLDELQARYPLDPMVSLTELQLLAILPSDKGLRAGPRLEKLFETSGRKTLDQLRRGCTRRWIDFLLPLAPDTAMEVLQRDLEIEPGNLDVWQLLGDVAYHRGDKEAARGYYETLLAIDPRPEAAFALAELMIEEGARAAEVKPILNQASRVQAGGSARATFLSTIADLRDKNLNAPSPFAPKLEVIVPRLRGLWNSRDRIRKEVETVELGLLYADALFQHLRELDLAPLRAAEERAKKWRIEDGKLKRETQQTPSEAVLAARKRSALEADRRLGQELAVQYEDALRDLEALMAEFVEIADTSLYADQLVKAMAGLTKAISARNRPAELRSLGTPDP